ncbi:hypothetical protein ACXR0O_28225 [Verrucomicrobiota bacterium sgz303538]
MFLTRRAFVALVAALTVSTTNGADHPRQLDIQIIDLTDFDAREDDLRAVMQSAASELWKYCPRTRFEVPGFKIFHRNEEKGAKQGKKEVTPITLTEHDHNDGRIMIGLTTKGRKWGQVAFQFAHEFCHALVRHSNTNWARTDHNLRAKNLWFEESLCETASLFVLRAMAITWRNAPPFPNWLDYAPALSEYAENRLAMPEHQLPAGLSFEEWFRSNESKMRDDPTGRERNCIVARQMLPLFEKHPEGWEAVTFLNLGKPTAEKTREQYFAEWRENTPAELRSFVERIEAIFPKGE